MIFRGWRFYCALALTICQQALLAISTYFIALAGMKLESGNAREVLSCVSLFFLFALLSYVVSSLSSLIAVRASNEAWRSYTKQTLQLSTLSMQHASDKNKKSIAQWLGGEANSTISFACDFYLGLISVGLNIILTLLVFYLSIGWQITLAMAASLIISLCFVLPLRRKIESYAGDMQQQKLRALLSIEAAWGTAMFGSRKMRDEGFHELEKKTESYFGSLNQYVVLEQIIACCPIIISTAVVIWLIQYTGFLTLAVIGALVAILPRTLQVFGSVHSLSIYLSQFFLIRKKLVNLNLFASNLVTQRLEQAGSPDKFLLLDSISSIQINPQNFLYELQEGRVSGGRFTITGGNGVGKSSYLKVVRALVDDSILMTPETNFTDSIGKLSTGQARIKEIEAILSSPPPVVMLDEWDANLDEENFNKIDAALRHAASRIVIIEVRHKRINQDAAII
jgi:ABC-type bacteriocin/lantibiotic exporter with double-glycine peptidase domain